MNNKKSIINDGPLHDIRVMAPSHLEDLYGIEIGDDGEVWDPVEYKAFDTLREWAEYYIEVNTDPDDFSPFGKKQDWDDEY